MRYIAIDTRSSTPVFQQIVDQIRGQVVAGDPDPGAPLPSVRQLAFDLGINPNTVAKSYMLLERDGVTETIRRRGPFIAQDAQGRAGSVVDRRMDEAVDRLINEATNLGLDPQRFLEAVRQRLKRVDPNRGEPDGRSS